MSSSDVSRLSTSSANLTPCGWPRNRQNRPAEPSTLREPPCSDLMRIIEIFRRGQKPMSRAPPREQAA